MKIWQKILSLFFGKCNLSLIGFLIISAIAFCQEPYLRKHGLPDPYNQAIVYCIHQGDQEKIWLGTDQGLLFFDGVEVELIEPLVESLKWITSIQSDQLGRLWVGSNNGMLGRVNEWDKIVEPVLSQYLGSAITSISFYSPEEVFFSTYQHGLYLWKDNRMQSIGHSDAEELGDIYDILFDRGRLWVATDRGLLVYEQQGTSEDWLAVDGNFTDTPDEIVRLVRVVDEHKICIGTQRGYLAIYDINKKEWVNYRIPQEALIEDVAFVHDQEIWIATRRKGIWRFNPKTNHWQVITSTNSRTYDLEYDKEGNIWFYSDGLGLVSSNRYFDFLDLGISEIQCVMHSKDGIWMGTKHGLYFWDGKQTPYSPRSALKHKNIISLYEDSFGNIWAGTFGQGIQLYQPKSKRVKQLNLSDGLTNGNILDIAGRANKIWLATLGGVMEIETNKLLFSDHPLSIKNYNKSSGLGTNFIYCVYPDNKGRVWFGTDGKGISVLENGEITSYASGTSIVADKVQQYSFPTVYSIAADQYGKIWFSTPENEVYNYDGKHFSQLNRPSRIGNHAITGLETDAQGKVLVIHETGIDHLIPGLNHQMYFGESVGLQNFEPNINSSSVDDQGNVWIASNNYLVKCQTLGDVVKIHPSTIITEISASLKPIDWSAKHTLDHHQNHLVFSYAGLWYTDPDAVRYRYRLNGYDKDWISSKDVVATYSSLPAGSYSFEVMSTENMEFHVEPITKYTFEIKQAFWKTAWFLALLIFLGITIIVLYVRWIDNQVRNMERLKKEKAESQLEALKTQINPHFLFNNFNTLISIIEEEPKMAVEYVEHLSDFYRSILKYREHTLIPLSEELRTLENYAFLLRKRFGNNFSLKTEVSHPEVKVIPLSLQRLVENAMKHNTVSKLQPLHIRVQQIGNAIQVSNNINPKLKPEQSTGFGLSSLIAEYQLVSQAKVEVKQNEKEFHVILPAI